MSASSDEARISAAIVPMFRHGFEHAPEIFDDWLIEDTAVNRTRVITEGGGFDRIQAWLESQDDLPERLQGIGRAVVETWTMFEAVQRDQSYLLLNAADLVLAREHVTPNDRANALEDHSVTVGRLFASVATNPDVFNPGTITDDWIVAWVINEQADDYIDFVGSPVPSVKPSSVMQAEVKMYRENDSGCPARFAKLTHPVDGTTTMFDLAWQVYAQDYASQYVRDVNCDPVIAQDYLRSKVERPDF